jgi:hypothetical protein
LAQHSCFGPTRWSTDHDRRFVLSPFDLYSNLRAWPPSSPRVPALDQSDLGAEDCGRWFRAVLPELGTRRRERSRSTPDTPMIVVSVNEKVLVQILHRTPCPPAHCARCCASDFDRVFEITAVFDDLFLLFGLSSLLAESDSPRARSSCRSPRSGHAANDPSGDRAVERLDDEAIVSRQPLSVPKRTTIRTSRSTA